MSFLESLKAEEAKHAAPAAPSGGGLFDVPGNQPDGRGATNPADPTVGAADDAPDEPAINPPEGEGKGRGKGKRGKGEKGSSKLDEADIDAIAERVADKLATRLMRGVQ